MKRSHLLLSGLFVACLAASQVQAADALATKPSHEGASGLPIEWAAMANVLNFTDDQKAKLAEIAKARETALADWEKENGQGQKLKDARKELEAARKAGDKDAIAKAREQITPLEAAREKVLAPFHKQVMDLLTPDQKALWAEHNLVAGINTRLKNRGIELSDEQTAKVKELAKDSAKQLAELKDDTEKGRGEIHQKLWKEVREQVLTPEQKAKLEPNATTNSTSRPGRDGTPAEKTNRK